MFLITWGLKLAGGLGGSPLFRKLVTYGFIVLLGFAWGNYHATQRALTEKASEAAAEEAKTTGALFNAYKGKINDLKTHLAEDRAKDQVSDLHAATAIAAATGSARTDHDAAVAQIAKEVNQEKAKEIINVSALCPPVEPFRFSPDTRRLLNDAAGALYSPGPTPSGAPAAGSVRGIAPAAPARAASTGR